jgi:hypothetical protein
MIEGYVPEGLAKLSVFEDYSDEFIAMFRTTSLLEVNSIRIADSRFSAAFARRSLGLEPLSVSFMADARHFFQARRPSWTWHRLQSLILTSRQLTSTADGGAISSLLNDAGTAALQMPKLRTMVLWNGGKGEVCAFTYRRNSEKPSIIWQGTWDADLASDVIDVWEKVASEYTPRPLRIESHSLSCGTIKSHGDAIFRLNLPREVIDPLSLWQIRMGGSIGRGTCVSQLDRAFHTTRTRRRSRMRRRVPVG